MPTLWHTPPCLLLPRRRRLADLLTPQASFDAIAERLLVGPVVRTLVYDKIPVSVVNWVDSMVRDWPFVRIIPCHFAAPIRAGAQGWQQGCCREPWSKACSCACMRVLSLDALLAS